VSDILSPERVIDRLVTQDIFADLDPVSLRVIALAGETLSLKRGDILFSEGDASDGAYFILEGAFSLQGTESKELAAQSGDLLHPLALLTDLKRPATAKAKVPSEILKIPRQVFLRILNNAPALALRLRDKLTRDLSRRAQELQPFEA
jgi:CRP-like cAMP-binding protein